MWGHEGQPLPAPAGGFASQWQNAGTLKGNTWEGTFEARKDTIGSDNDKTFALPDDFIIELIRSGAAVELQPMLERLLMQDICQIVDFFYRLS